jgi:hypothetical protein
VSALAVSALRLAVRIAAVSDPPDPVVELLGQRPTTQRSRLRRDSAVERVAVYLDEQAQPWPNHAGSIGELLGSRSSGVLYRFDYDSVTRSVGEAREPDRAGVELGL